MTPLLQFSNVSFHYAERTVLSKIDLTLHAGTCVALVGANGSGKTTLLRIASGTLAVSSGTVMLEGHNASSLLHRQRSRLVALVPQQLDIPFDFTVQQIVEQGRTPYLGLLRGPSQADYLAVEHALDLTDTRSLRHRIFNELSGGERQRVKIALGLAQEAKLLLLDEPVAGMNHEEAEEIRDIMVRLRASGLSILLIEHDMNFVMRLCDFLYVLDFGVLIAKGQPDEIRNNPVVLDAYLGKDS